MELKVRLNHVKYEWMLVEAITITIKACSEVEITATPINSDDTLIYTVGGT